MGFRGRKSYGNYKTSTCPFCGKIATHKNEQGLEVCLQHTKAAMEEIKCTCGSWLEQRSGKFGAYFNCINCGNINLKKALEMKSLMKITSSPIESSKLATSTDSSHPSAYSSSFQTNSSSTNSPSSNYSSSFSTNSPSSNYSSSFSTNSSSFPVKKPAVRKEIVISSRDVEYFD